MARQPSWPRIRFREKGPRIPEDRFPALDFGWELHYYEFLHRWNGGIPSPDCFKVKMCDGPYQVARVKYFHGVSIDHPDGRDLRHAVYHMWYALPRHTIPIAAIDIEDDEWDLCTLLTFTWSERCNKIYLLANLHDTGPYDPDDLSRLQPIANSLPQFLRLLRPYDSLKYRSWYCLSTSVSSLDVVSRILNANGFNDWGQYSGGSSLESVRFDHEAEPYAVWLASPRARIQDIPCPKVVPAESSLLAIDAHRWEHPRAAKSIKALLASQGLDFKLKKLGDTSIRRSSL